MTILMTLIGLVVALFSLIGNPFKVAAKRFVYCAATGVFIDMTLISISAVSTALALA